MVNLTGGALRDLIFKTPLTARLETILHPLIRADMEQSAELAVGPYVVMAIPLLVEGGPSEGVDRVLVVDVDEAVQLQRVRAARRLYGGAGTRNPGVSSEPLGSSGCGRRCTAEHREPSRICDRRSIICTRVSAPGRSAAPRSVI